MSDWEKEIESKLQFLSKWLKDYYIELLTHTIEIGKPRGGFSKYNLCSFDAAYEAQLNGYSNIDGVRRYPLFGGDEKVRSHLGNKYKDEIPHQP